MNRLNDIVFASVLALFAVFSSGAAQADKDWNTLDGFVKTGMEMWHVPGMAVTVVSSDEVLYQRGFGQTAVAGGEEIGEHTLFANASTTKAMVVSGILMLVDAEKLSLDDLVI